MKSVRPTLEDIAHAQERIAPYVHRTPVLTSQAFGRVSGAQLFFKCENLQRVGAFKMRGASNAVFSLDEQEARRGVATHSSGNHAQALALAAKMRGIEAHIVIPEGAPEVKVSAVRDYGANIVRCKSTLESRETTLEEVVSEVGAVVIHPYNDTRIIAGQGTAVVELLEKAGELDIVLAPIGGGGLISGTAIATKAISPRTRVIGVEPEGAADAYRGFKEGKFVPSINPNTIADGLLSSLGELTLPIIHDLVDDIVTVNDKEIVSAMRFVWERMKTVIEPSAAVPVAAVLEGKIEVTGLRVGVILSGGNIDLDNLPF